VKSGYKQCIRITPGGIMLTKYMVTRMYLVLEAVTKRRLTIEIADGLKKVLDAADFDSFANG
jgi:hypothetical protein